MSVNQYTFPFDNLNDSDFINVVSGNEQHRFPLSVINNLSFNRYNFNDDNLLNDYIIRIPECNYYFSDTLLTYQLPENNLKLLCHNISSIPLHFDSFIDQFSEQIDTVFDIIGFCETRLNDAISSIYNIHNYTSYFQNKNTLGGGVAIFLKRSFNGVILSDISFQLPHVETLFIRVRQPFSFIAGVIYRPPNANLDDFLRTIEFISDFLVTINLQCYVMGDFNINLLKDDNRVSDFINLFYSYHFFSNNNKTDKSN